VPRLRLRANFMGVPFDHIATTYDSVFTRTAIGQLQRKRVWSYIEQIIPQLKGFEMLELNCGTGEDAIMFGEKGFNIIATDISHEMLNVTYKKAEQFSMQSKISSHYLDLESFDETLFNKKFDLVFSNFGGLNCINPESLKTLINKLPLILNPGGRFVAVIMPKFCAWETAFFMLQFQFRKAFRRLTSKEVLSNLHGVVLKSWYYNPAQIKTWSADKFKLIAIRPIGLILPPSYLENFFMFRKRWLLHLNNFEKRLSQRSSLSGMADHFVIDMQLR
jgi:ubiquinone/menaquinone biosynthesis C-methylase UbiE